MCESTTWKERLETDVVLSLTFPSSSVRVGGLSASYYDYFVRLVRMVVPILLMIEIFAKREKLFIIKWFFDFDSCDP